LMFLELKHIPPTYTGPVPPLYPFAEVVMCCSGFLFLKKVSDLFTIWGLPPCIAP
jgi:hypothetical protein